MEAEKKLRQKPKKKIILKSKMATYGGPGVQGGTSLQNPKYDTYVTTTVLTSIVLGSGVPQPFPRITGHQKIVLQFSNAPIPITCSFSVTGGSNSSQQNGVPMFPNPKFVYNPSINFVPTENQLGCSVAFSQAPKTSKSTRVNLFSVTETVTGNNWQFNIAMSPFANVPNLITFPLPQAIPLTGTVTIVVYSYRGIPYMRETGIPVAFNAPEYSEREFVTTFPGGPNPLDIPGVTLPFYRFGGQQDIVFIIPGFFFQFSIDYGILGQAGGYIGLVGPNANPILSNPPPQNCIVTPVSVPGSQMTQQPFSFLVEDTNTGNERTYAFTFYPNPTIGQKPTISLVGGPDLGVLDSTLKIVTRHFTTI